MDTAHSKSAWVYRQVRRDLRSGRYIPGQRLDPAQLATNFHTSPTPVRFALYRLVGERLIVDHARDGLQIPLFTEVALRDLYDWTERLLLMACDDGVAPTNRKTPPPKLLTADGNLVKQTWQLFDAIARATPLGPLRYAMKQANDRLAPVKHTEHELLRNPFEELSKLHHHWRTREIDLLKEAVHTYHQRRKQLVPAIVAQLHEQGD